MPSTKIRRTWMAVYRLKDLPSGTAPFDDVAKPKQSDIIAKAAALGGSWDGMLLVRSKKQDHPDWVRFLKPVATGVAQLMRKSATNSAALIARKGAVRYALVFGYGRALLNPSAIEYGFGLRCAIALVDPQAMTSVNTKQINHRTLYSNIQSNVSASFGEFGVDTESTLLSGIFGKPPKKRTYLTRTHGSDALYINPAITARGIPAMLTWLTKVYAAKKYVNAGFDWIDNVAIVRDTAVLATLRDEVDKALASGKCRLGPPEWINHERIAGFRVAGSANVSDQISLKDLRKEAAALPITVDVLEKMRVEALDDRGVVVTTWSSFRWLVWGGVSAGDSYVLQDGFFYHVSPHFEAKIDTYLEKSVKKLAARWNDWTPTGKKSEAAYNRQLANKLGSAGVLLDAKKFSKTFNGQGAIEFCDVLDHKGAPWLVCVKKYSGSSAPLSHLFMQGANSIDTLIEDAHFRAELRADASIGSLVPVDTPAPGAFGVAFVILTRKKRRKLSELPFFAKLSLYRFARDAARRGIPLRAGTRAIK